MIIIVIFYLQNKTFPFFLFIIRVERYKRSIRLFYNEARDFILTGCIITPICQLMSTSVSQLVSQFGHVSLQSLLERPSCRTHTKRLASKRFSCTLHPHPLNQYLKSWSLTLRGAHSIMEEATSPKQDTEKLFIIKAFPPPYVTVLGYSPLSRGNIGKDLLPSILVV